MRVIIVAGGCAFAALLIVHGTRGVLTRRLAVRGGVMSGASAIAAGAFLVLMGLGLMLALVLNWSQLP